MLIRIIISCEMGSCERYGGEGDDVSMQQSLWFLPFIGRTVILGCGVTRERAQFFSCGHSN